MLLIGYATFPSIVDSFMVEFVLPEGVLLEEMMSNISSFSDIIGITTQTVYTMNTFIAMVAITIMIAIRKC